MSTNATTDVPSRTGCESVGDCLSAEFTCPEARNALDHAMMRELSVLVGDLWTLRPAACRLSVVGRPPASAVITRSAAP
jgi:enoyl-CoA hydratase/carnithine racemase